LQALGALGSLAQLAFDGRAEPRQVPLHEVVAGACPYHLDRCILADRA
jgi:hypothetical protein